MLWGTLAVHVETAGPRTGALQDRCLRAMQSATREGHAASRRRGDMLNNIGEGYKSNERGRALDEDGEISVRAWPFLQGVVLQAGRGDW